MLRRQQVLRLDARERQPIADARPGVAKLHDVADDEADAKRGQRTAHLVSEVLEVPLDLLILLREPTLDALGCTVGFARGP